jgi:twinkle protein
MNVAMELSSLGLSVKRTEQGNNGMEARLSCPLCKTEGEPTMQVNMLTGVWKCHRCQETGNLFQLRLKLRGESPRLIKPISLKKGPTRVPAMVINPGQVEEMHKALKDDEEAWLYVAGKRGFSEEMIKKFSLGLSYLKPKRKAIAIPYFFAGKCIGIKYRIVSPGEKERKYERAPGCQIPLFNMDSLNGQFSGVIITEGELDTIAMTQYDVGMPVVSIPNGATAALDQEAAEALMHFDTIYLALDEDEKGEEGAEKLAERLGAFRCRRVRLPAKDANECLVDGVTREAILMALQAAAPFYESCVLPVSNWAERLLKGDVSTGRARMTGWKGFDKLLGGLRPGEVTLLTADTGNGKTTYALDIIRRQSESGHATMVASLEVPTLAVARKLLSGASGKRWDHLTGKELEEGVTKLSKLPLCLLDRYGSVDADRLREEVEYAVRRHGVSTVVIDHLHFMLGVKGKHDDEVAKIDAAAMAIQNMAIDFGIHVVLVVHPAKIRTEKGHKREPDTGDLKGSSGPGQFADNIMRISRKEGDRAVVTLLKVRSELGKCGSIVFAFDPESLTFTEIEARERKSPEEPPHWTEERDPGEDEEVQP